MHSTFILEHGERYFPSSTHLREYSQCKIHHTTLTDTLARSDGADQDILLFARELEGESIVNLFSVVTGSRQAVKYRCMVYHVGQDSGTGSWRCDKDGDNGCGHVTKARHHLQQLVQRDPNARDPLVESENVSGMLSIHEASLPNPSCAFRHSCYGYTTC